MDWTLWNIRRWPTSRSDEGDYFDFLPDPFPIPTSATAMLDPTPLLRTNPLRHQSIRVAHEMKRRTLTVTQAFDLSPKMRRIVFRSDELKDFASAAPDDHIKLLFPTADGGMAKRDYTPRTFDRKRGELVVDFALHDNGPATDWALAAEPGFTLASGGPKMSVKVPYDFDWWLLIGDEAAIPAIARRLEEMPANTLVTAVVAVTDRAEEQNFSTTASLATIWVHRPLEKADNPSGLVDALHALPPRSGEGFVWIGGEALVCRALRAELIERYGQPREWIKARGYWRLGEVGASERIGD